MNTQLILLGILPLFVFVIVDSFAGLRAGLISAILLSIAELVFSLYYFGEIDAVTWASFALVAVMAAVSYYKKTALHIKLQPVILSTGIGILLLTYQMMGKPLLLDLAIKYKTMLPPEQQAIIATEQMRAVLTGASLSLGIAHFIHAALVLWAALKLSNWWWIVFRAVLYYVLMIGACVISAFIYRLQA